MWINTTLASGEALSSSDLVVLICLAELEQIIVMTCLSVFSALVEPVLILKGDTAWKHTPCSSSSSPSVPKFNPLKLRKVLINVLLAVTLAMVG